MTAYYMLITSLPRHNRHYKIKQTPISRIQLDKRLKLLTTRETILLNDIIYCLWTSWFESTLPFQVTKVKAEQLLALKNPFIDNMINWFFDLRSVFVALRLRQIQPSPPENPQALWFTHWNKKLITHWHAPDFGLQYVYPWLPAINTKITNHDTAALEDIFLTIIWKHLEKIEDRHFYDFEGLIIYLMRWHIVNYWSQFNEKIAAGRIRALINKLLAESHLDEQANRSFS